MGGAKNCPETPRQRMIGMMYLVLTAMLALNVSTNVLDAFGKVDSSLHKTLDNTVDANNNYYQRFETALKENPEKTKEWYDKAMAVKAESDSMYNYLQEFKYQVALLVDGEDADPEARNIQNTSDFDKTGQYALVQYVNYDGGYYSNGEVLKKKLEKYRQFLKETQGIEDGDRRAKMVDDMFSTGRGVNADGDSISWEASVFDGMPAGASMAILTKYQNDVRTYEGKVVSELFGQIDAGDLRVNKLNAYVISNSNYVIRGERYHAQIILAAVDSTSRPDYYVNGQKIGADGVYDVVATGTGIQVLKGKIVYRNGNDVQELPFDAEYTVGEPSATVSNVQTTVVYRGYENQMSVSVPGVPNDKVKLTAAGDAVVKPHKATKDANYNFGLIPGEKCGKVLTVIISAEMNGKWQEMGRKDYKVLPMPKPQAYFQLGDNLYEDNVPLSILTNMKGEIVADYGPEALFSVPWKILSFKLSLNGVMSEVKGTRFSKKDIEKLSKLKKNADVPIKDITACGPDGKPTKLKNIVLTVK